LEQAAGKELIMKSHINGLEGRFITFEGVDGCGKTTQVAKFAAWLRENVDVPVMVGRQPGDTPLGKRIRELIVSESTDYSMSSEAELFMFLSDRAQHVNEVIRPFLESGGIFICDRYSDSTRAYQLAARDLNSSGFLEKDLDTMLKVAECGVSPDLTFWIDVDIETSIARIEARANSGGEAKNRLDNEAKSFHAGVASGYEGIWRDEWTRMARISGVDDIDTVHGNVIDSCKRNMSIKHLIIGGDENE